MELNRRPSDEKEEAMEALPPAMSKVVEENQVVEESGQQERDDEKLGESEAEEGSVPDEATRRRTKKLRLRGNKELLADKNKFIERANKREKGTATLAGLVSSRAQRNKRMIEEQHKERTEGKMSGITLSLPRTFSFMQAAAKEQANTVQKLRSYAGIATDQALRQPSLKEASTWHRASQRRKAKALTTIFPSRAAFMMDFMMDDGSAKERERLSREHIAKINAKIEACDIFHCTHARTHARTVFTTDMDPCAFAEHPFLC
jgi:hypothetical protein